jgi:hypothetical protein
MITKYRLILMMGLCLIIISGAYVAGQLSAQTPRQEAIDYNKAATAEVRDSQGRVVLRGQFSVTDNDPNDMERKALLSPTTVDSDAFGQAEIEFSGSGAQRRHEIEFEVRNLEPGSVFTLVIDGKKFATVTTTGDGHAEYEKYVPIT